jgi:hypothetical protein
MAATRSRDGRAKWQLAHSIVLGELKFGFSMRSAAVERVRLARTAETKSSAVSE